MTDLLEAPAVLAAPAARPRLDYRAVWRWHFYAGLIAIPFVLILSLSGGVYLFRPQIEAWLDRSYDHLSDAIPRQSPSAVITAAVDAVPGATLNAYELPAADDSAARVLLNTPDGLRRVYVHPRTLAVLGSVLEISRPMRWVFRLHGELLMGNPGSYVVEVASSWTIVLLLTGLWLWWPRGRRGLGGVLYPRFGSGRRVAVRDLHAVTGFWVSGLALVLLASGLPWAKFWGDYFRTVRQTVGIAGATQDWVNGAAPTGGEHAMHGGMRGGMHGGMHMPPITLDAAAFDRVVAVATSMGLDDPVQVKPPGHGGPWTVASMAANRPKRQELTLDDAGRVLTRSGFADKRWPDRLVAIGVAWHEGQLFGWLNQLLGLAAALGLVLVCGSAVWMWWKRRPIGRLGAPAVSVQRGGLGWVLVAVVALGMLLPLFAASLAVVWVLEFVVLRRVTPLRHWLGLRPVVAAL